MPRGYAIHDSKNWTDFKITDFELKTAEADDVTLKITHCGVCGSDVHTISGGWGPFTTKFVIPGHEIIGIVTEVGPNVKDIKVGDRVGVGAQVGSCLNCPPCNQKQEQYCSGDGQKGMVDTYNAIYAHLNEEAQGGYSTAIRAHQQFVFPIPDALESTDAASMLCAGATVWSPLVRNGAGEGKRVGIVGLGGLGHYGVLWAAALGAEVVVISHSASKKDDALKMGAKEFIATGEDEKWAEKLAKNPLDLIVSTASSNAIDLGSMLSTLKVHGKMISVGLPEEHFNMKIQSMVANGSFIGSSHIASKLEILDMLKLAADKQVKPWIEVLDMKDAAVAVKNIESGKVRYRQVLVQDIEQ
ncbi:alcohol dehydrogenase [Tilletia horrida]|uniref:alcohol dehydrogenase (NADP(+)) n=1 Tax=Tilletia horrida TaxID=155126 RepID=A0AAN6JW12_9BASI|nr:alcohol dehydrogenase [Tilletia horrida]KAK0556160.1 alcohol dehydrogenase [Tilletia horrida]KAK0569086.1 alcohol dehydrogenase [Tilletia horrida]